MVKSHELLRYFIILYLIPLPPYFLPGFFIQAGIDLFARAHQKQKAYSEPYTKTLIRAMDKAISNHIAWDDWPKWNEIFSKYFTQDMIYDTNYFDGTNHQFGNGTGIRRFEIEIFTKMGPKLFFRSFFFTINQLIYRSRSIITRS